MALCYESGLWAPASDRDTEPQSGVSSFETWACDSLDWIFSCDPTKADDLKAAMDAAEDIGGGWVISAEKEAIAFVDEEGQVYPAEEAPVEIPEDIKPKKKNGKKAEPSGGAGLDVKTYDPPAYLAATPPPVKTAWLWVGGAAILGIWIISMGDQ
jgi:hypothetical protein